jgi:hypothetical protein
MNKTLLLAVTLLSSTVAAQADNRYQFIGLEMENNAYLLTSDAININPALSAKIVLGIGYRYELNENFLLENELSIDYSKTNFSTAADTFLINNTSQADVVGLWATTRLSRLNLFTTSFAKISPYVELSVGRVGLDFQNDEFANHDSVTAYKAVTGLTFEFDNDMRFSFGLGLGDSQNIKPFN